MDVPAEGGCICGAIRYRLTRRALALYACHCTDCQRHTGTAFGMSMIVESKGLELLHGDPWLYVKDWPDGRQWRGRFCDECATRVWDEPLKVPQVRILRPGTLDDPSDLVPDAHAWTGSKLSWVAIPSDARCFAGQPTDAELLEIIEARQEREKR